MQRAWGALAALCLVTVPAAARADERIVRFQSDVQVQKDSSIEVAESIDVRAEHDQINHGIYRDLPTRYRGAHGGQIHIGFRFEGATLDGNPVKASVEPSGNGVRIKLGDPDTYVDVGEHLYVIRYRATREIGRFQDFDELYWNVTGNNWIFPIDEAAVRIRLPEAVSPGQRAAYTGPLGSKASDAEVTGEKPGEISFATTRPLGPYEGLTVAVAFPKGVVAQPSSGSRLLDLLADYGPPLLGLLSLIGLCAFYYVAWQRAGKDPRAGTVVPIFTPPDDLSPAAMRFVSKMGADNRTFAAALVDMAVRGHIRLIDEDGGWFSAKTRIIERLASSAPLPHDEQETIDRLGEPGDSIEMKQRNHEIFSSAMRALSNVLKEQYEGKMFKRNYGWAAAGLLFFVAALWLTCAAVVVSTGGGNALLVGVIFGILLVAGLLWLAFHETAVGKCLLSLVTVAALPIVFTLGMPILGEALNSRWLLPFILPALALPLAISAFWWISAPTLEGRKVLDRIAGFKQYLSITEGERLDRMTPPKDTPELFEKYLPYAIALGVENHWAERFASVLAAAAAQGQQGFVWYSGSNNPWDSPTDFANSVGSSLASTISSASAAPGSSSGSGGGGSSGGGGGGGGGGGW